MWLLLFTNGFRDSLVPSDNEFVFSSSFSKSVIPWLQYWFVHVRLLPREGPENYAEQIRLHHLGRCRLWPRSCTSFVFDSVTNSRVFVRLICSRGKARPIPGGEFVKITSVPSRRCSRWVRVRRWLMSIVRRYQLRCFAVGIYQTLNLTCKFHLFCVRVCLSGHQCDSDRPDRRGSGTGGDFGQSVQRLVVQVWLWLQQ